MTNEQIIQKAEKRLAWYHRFYFSIEVVDESDRSKYASLFEKYNDVYWKNKADINEAKEKLSLDNVIKAIRLQEAVEEVGYKNYDRYHWIIETTSLVDMRYDSYEKRLDCGGYLQYVLDADGDIEEAFKKLMGDGEVFCDYANDIADTAW